MAEFVKVMKERERMCNSFRCGCEMCPDEFRYTSTDSSVLCCTILGCAKCWDQEVEEEEEPE